LQREKSNLVWDGNQGGLDSATRFPFDDNPRLVDHHFARLAQSFDVNIAVFSGIRLVAKNEANMTARQKQGHASCAHALLSALLGEEKARKGSL
jgi:hypothetical protein